MIYLQIAEALTTGGQPSFPFELSILERAAQETLKYARAGPQVEASLVLSDDAQLHELNQQFLGIDAPTDVLAFPSGETDPDSQEIYLGDIILSYPRAQVQAAVGGHPVEAELQLLVVHGMLHLLGHDHTEPEQKTAMWAAQRAVLANLGLADIAPAG